MELTTEQLKSAEIKLEEYLPVSQMVYGTLLLMNRVRADPMKVFVDNWPNFNVVVCKPTREQKSDTFKDLLIFAKDNRALAKILRNGHVFDWTLHMCIGTNVENREIFKEVALEKQSVWRHQSVCHMMILNDLSSLPEVNCAEISFGSLNESHIDLINRTWKYGEDDAVTMLRNMVKNFPTCCVLDSEGRPVSWVMTYVTCALGILYTLPEHRGKGYARAVVSAMAKRLISDGYPVYCFIEEENAASLQLFKKLGFTAEPSYRQTWFDLIPVAD